MNLHPNERTLDYGVQGQDKVRLIKLYKSGDHNLGIIAKYDADSAVTGSLSDDNLFDLTLDDGTNIVERTHFAYFPATNILAVEYNQSGAREGTLKWYVNKIMSQHESDPLVFGSAPVFHPDALDKLRDARAVTVLELGLPKERVANRTEGNNLFSALNAASSIGNVGQISLTLNGSKKRGDRRQLMTKDQLLQAINQGEIDLGAFEKVNARLVYEQGSELVNLLENRISSHIEMPGQLTISKESEWFQKIVDNYTVNRALLVRASGDND
jgi:hypothetical protein